MVSSINSVVQCFREKHLPSNTAKAKYCKEPHPLLRLSRSALPPDISVSLVEKAVETFSCSVTQGTQSGYATAARHIDAEKSLGRHFSCPPTDQEMMFLVTHLVSKGLGVSTV